MDPSSQTHVTTYLVSSWAILSTDDCQHIPLNWAHCALSR